MKVGSQLKSVLANTWKIPTCGVCHQTAKEMDQRTPQQIRDDVDVWAERLHQNAKNQKWTALIKEADEYEERHTVTSVVRTAAIKVFDGVTHTVVGNALYRRLILDVCDYVERMNVPCVYRGDLNGKAPWNKSLDRYRCNCENVHKDFCVLAPITSVDVALSKGDGTAICSLCEFKEVEL